MIFRGLVLVVVAALAVGCGKAASSEGERVHSDADGGKGEDIGAGTSADAGAGKSADGGKGEGTGKAKGTDTGEGEKARAGVRKLALDAEEVTAIFSKIPRLRALSEDLRLFGEPYDVNVVKRRGSQEVDDWLFTANPVLWTPTGGEPHLVLAGKSKKDSFVVALERLPSGDYELASSLVFRNDPGPFVLAYQQNARERLLWTSCWKCKGDGGAIVAKDSGKRVVVIQQ